MKATSWILFFLSAVIIGWIWPKSDHTAPAELSTGKRGSTKQPSLLGRYTTEKSHSSPESQAEQSFQEQASICTEDYEFAMLFQRWAEVDPEGMVEWATKRGSTHPFHGTKRLREAWRAWGREDFTSAWEQAQERKLKRYVRNEIIVSAGLQNPVLVAEWFENLPEDTVSSYTITRFVEPWASKDPEAALAFAQRIDTRSGKTHFQERALQGVARIQPERALSYAQQNAQSGPLLEDVFYGAVDDHPDWARANLDALPDNQQEKFLKHIAVSISNQGDLDRAWEMTKTLSKNFRDETRAELFFEFQERYPEEAENHLEEILGTTLDTDQVGKHAIYFEDMAAFHLNKLTESEPERAAELAIVSENDWIKGEIMKTWAKADMIEAATWMNAQENENSLHTSFWYSHVSGNEELQMQLATSLPPGELQEHSALGVVEAVLEDRGAAGALSWAKEAQSTQLETRVWKTYLLQNADAALEDLQTLPPDQVTPALQGIVSGIAANKNFSAGAALVDANFDSEEDIGARALANAWRVEDPEAAITWIDSLPESTIKEEVVHDLIETLARPSEIDYHPAMAMEWMKTLPLNRRRSVLAKRTYRIWMHADETAARNFIEDPDLPAELTDLLQSK